MKKKMVVWLLVGILGITSFPMSILASENTENTGVVENSNVVYASEDFTEDNLEGVSTDENSFPDDTFRQYVQENLDTDNNKILSDTEIMEVTELSLTDAEMNNMDIADLTGIEYFTELVTLDCQNTTISTLDLTQNTKLEEVNITGNQLLAIDISQCSQLKSLECSNNHLDQLDLTGNQQLVTGVYAEQMINNQNLSNWFYDENYEQSVTNVDDITAVAGNKIFLSTKNAIVPQEQTGEVIENNELDSQDTSESQDISNDYSDIQNSTAASGKAMYRLYNPNSGEHFYTASTSERNHLSVVGWSYEGIAWYAPTSGTPVYRLYNPNAGDHHYTTGIKERKMLVSVGWKYEGIGWYSVTVKTVVLYRLYNPNATGAGAHHYTTSAGEKNSLVRIGWRYEGIGWYAVAAGTGIKTVELTTYLNDKSVNRVANAIGGMTISNNGIYKNYCYNSKLTIGILKDKPAANYYSDPVVYNQITDVINNGNSNVMFAGIKIGDPYITVKVKLMKEHYSTTSNQNVFWWGNAASITVNFTNGKLSSYTWRLRYTS